jgi:ABC-type transport system substrate-binding protein
VTLRRKCFNNSRPGLRHLEVRQAIARAIDYSAFIAKITHGVGTFAHDIVPPTAIGFVDNPPYRYDPAGARLLLEEHGWKRGPDGIRKRGEERLELVLLTVTGSSGGNAFAVQLQAWLRAIGIALDIKFSPYNEIFSYNGPIQSCDQFPPKGQNVYRYCDPQVDAGERKRAAIYAPVERRIHETVPYIPLDLGRRAVAHVKALKNFLPAPTITEWWNAWEWSFDSASRSSP